jgi:hypothetical protein
MQTNAQGGVSWLVLFIYILRVNESRMRWIGHARITEEIRNTNKILVSKPEGKNGRRYLGETGVNGIILKWIGVNENEDVNCFHTAHDISVISGTKSVRALFKQSCRGIAVIMRPLRTFLLFSGTISAAAVFKQPCLFRHQQ